MKATDLRIDNLIQDAKGRICKVDGVKKDDTTEYEIDAWSKSSGIVTLPYGPIPLTEDWLVKLGLDASDLFIVREAIANFRGISEDDVILDYVHEIQNAWAVLEGQELEIKL